MIRNICNVLLTSTKCACTCILSCISVTYISYSFTLLSTIIDFSGMIWKLLEVGKYPLSLLNLWPLRLECLISPHNITPESHTEVAQIKEMITKLRKLLINNQILLIITQGNLGIGIENSMENMGAGGRVWSVLINNFFRGTTSSSSHSAFTIVGAD